MKPSIISAIMVALAIFLTSSITAIANKESDRILIGLDADISSGSAKSGEAIRRGAVLAIDEINKNGGVLGKQLTLVVRDHHGNPARGIDNIKELSQMQNLAAVIGGLHTPVAMAELEIVHESKVIYLCPWAAGTPVVANGFNPNYVFRVSVRDQFAGGFLAKKTLEKGYRRAALVLEQTGWGRSNNKAMTSALQSAGFTPAAVLWFNWGIDDFTDLILKAKESGAEVILFVANAPEGIAMIKSMASLPADQRLPVFSHWGITGGSFFDMTKEYLEKIDLVFLQTYSFINPVFPDRSHRLFKAYQNKYTDVNSPADIFAPAGTAHAYDLVHLLRLAMEQAGTIQRPAVRDALEKITSYNGIMKNYQPPFTRDRHDALTADDFIIARYNKQGHIIPITD